MSDRFCKIDLTPDECSAVSEMADIAQAQLRDMSSRFSKQEWEKLHGIIGSVKMKMGAAESLFGTVRETKLLS